MTAVLAKKGVESVSPNTALAVRTLVIAAITVGIVLVTKGNRVPTRSEFGWLALSGLATGASWLCYFRALKAGPVAKVAPIDKLSFAIAMILGFVFLKERPGANVWVGALIIAIGVLVTLK